MLDRNKLPTNSQPLSPDWRSLWALDPTITFLNHGSYGACPIAVLEQQQLLRARMEAEPVRFFGMELEELLDGARRELAAFVGAEPANLAFIPNATTGVNTVLRSLALRSDDELLTTDQEYNASRNALNFAANRAGARVVTAKIPFPITSPQQVVDAVLDQVSPKTRLVLLDHVVSQTALIFPIQDIIQALNQQSIETLIDGAHAPGMISLHLATLGATYYTGNCHKWLCAPKGAAFLYVRSDKLPAIRPLVISHGANSPRTDRSSFHLEFDWTGTHDPTAYLSVPTAIQFMGGLLPGGWAELMACNRQKALDARQFLCETLGVPPPAPAAMIGAMAAILLPDGLGDPLQTFLFHRFKIEVPVIPWYTLPKPLIRISAQLYNTLADYDDLARALVKLVAETMATGM